VKTVAGSNAEIRTALTGSNKAIGYLGFSYAEDGAVGAITLDGVKPTAETIKDGSYELARKLYFYTFARNRFPSSSRVCAPLWAAHARRVYRDAPFYRGSS
jgi:phosphate transport system substrate-binding protein